MNPSFTGLTFQPFLAGLKRAALCLPLLVLFICSACDLNLAPPPEELTPEPEATATAQPPEAPPQPGIPQAAISFQVQVPADTPADDPVMFNILDEVTGLALNARSFPMGPQPGAAGKPRSFVIHLTIPMGSAVTYRYERQSAGVPVLEHSSDGRAVRYRIYHVEGPGIVQDVVSRWTDTKFASPTGRIAGRALDASNKQPIPNLLIAAGGAQTFTSSDGSFLLEGLPPGIHNLVAFSMDGAYRTFQQGAEVAADSMTPAQLMVPPAQMTKVVFVVKLPANTPPIVPVRLAGNLYNLGNTFASLTGGGSSLAANMPVLSKLPDGRYSVTLSLPVGADIRYKYTLGDGFWNAEHADSGAFRLRQMVVNTDTRMVEDVVDTWQVGDHAPITFDLTVPAGTPIEDAASLQLNPLFGWTEPLPMWRLGDNRWAYILFGPLNLPGDLRYRYCRNGQCGSADDAATAGPVNEVAGKSRLVKLSGQDQILKDQVKAWQWLGPKATNPVSPTVARPRDASFMAGVEFQPLYHPSWKSLLPNILGSVEAMSPNWVVLAPTWTFSRSSPPVLEPVAGQDPLWFDLLSQIDFVKSRNLNVALFPMPHLPSNPDVWWQKAPRDPVWWVVFFERYRVFILHNADLATRTGSPALILGGDWLTPALPDGKLADGSPSNVPADAEVRWRQLLSDVRSHYRGKLLWALPDTEIKNSPAFLESVDGIYLLWSAPLVKKAGATPPEIAAEAGRRLDNEVLPLHYLYNTKPVILAAEYPSAVGALGGCVVAVPGQCLPISSLARPNPDLPAVQINSDEQVLAYAVLLAAVNSRDWVSGFVSRGYYPPAVLQDKSASVNGKPAGVLLRDWFSQAISAP